MAFLKTKSPIYESWRKLKQRCLNPKHVSYHNYGGRGIKVCERWMKFENFHEDMSPSWKQGLELDRTNNEGNYEPQNCRWATKSQNNKNKRNKASVQSQYPYISFRNRSDSKHPSRWIFQKEFTSKEEAEAFFLSVRSLL